VKASPGISPLDVARGALCLARYEQWEHASSGPAPAGTTAVGQA